MTRVEPTSDWPPPVDQGGFDDTVLGSAGVAVPPQPGRVQVLKRQWPMTRLTPYGAAGTSTSNSPPAPGTRSRPAPPDRRRDAAPALPPRVAPGSPLRDLPHG